MDDMKLRIGKRVKDTEVRRVKKKVSSHDEQQQP